MPNYLKAPGIGNAVSEELGPGKYVPDQFVETLRNQWKQEILKKTAIDAWHKQLFNEDKAENPSAFPDYLQRKSPGPGHYAMKEPFLERKTFAVPHKSGFNVNEPKNLGKINPVENPTAYVPGPGTYEINSTIGSDKNWGKQTWNMLSTTTGGMMAQIKHEIDKPASNTY